MRALALAVVLTGCASGGGEATWLTGFRYRWTNTNHRLSTLSAAPDGAAAEVAVVGGTSTTAVVFEDNTCPDDGAGCGELPVKDTWDLGLAWAHATSRKAVLGSGAVTATVGADPMKVEARVTLPRKVKAAEAWIGSISLESGAEQELPSCYDPRHGWTPRRISVAVGEASVDGAEVVVPVELAFEAGLTLEPLRACLDAAASAAKVGMVIGVVVVGLRDEAVEVTLVEQGNTVPFEPGVDQEPTADAVTAWSPVGALYGWRALSWWFHEADERGAYLRSLSFSLEDGAIGWATNDAPPVLLQSGFDFRFEGEVVSVDAEAEVVSYAAAEPGLAADVDEAGQALTWGVEGE